MVRSFNPQGRNSSIEANTNFAPQHGPQGGPPPPILGKMLYEDDKTMLYENGPIMVYE